MCFIKPGADDTQQTRVRCGAFADLIFAGCQIKLHPAAVCILQNALGAQNKAAGAVFFCKLCKDCIKRRTVILLRRFAAPVDKDLVGMVVMMFMVMIVTAAGAVPVVLIMVMMVLILVIVAAAVLVVVIMVMMVLMFMIVAAAGAVLVVVIVVMMVLMVVIVAAAVLVVLIVVMMVLMLVVMAAAGAVLVMFLMIVMMVMVCCFLRFFHQMLCKIVLLFHRTADDIAGQIVPRRGDDRCTGIVLLEQSNNRFQLCFVHLLGTGEDDRGCVFYLIVEEFTEVLHIHFCLGAVNDSSEAVQLCFTFGIGALCCTDDIGQLADTGRFDDDAVGCIVCNDLCQCFTEVSDERAADASGVDFGHFNAGILHEAAVNADLAEFVFDENELFALVAFGDQLLDEGCLTGTEKAGNDIYFGHDKSPLSGKWCGNRFVLIYYSTIMGNFKSFL